MRSKEKNLVVPFLFHMSYEITIRQIVIIRQRKVVRARRPKTLMCDAEDGGGKIE